MAAKFKKKSNVKQMTSSSPKKKAQPFKFEEAMAQLEGLVSSLERGDLPLEDALQAFDKGVGLVRQCQKTLKNAEMRVEKVLADEAGAPTGTEPLTQD